MADENPVWQDQAACNGATAKFFPARGESTAEAEAVCAVCPVILECRDFGLMNNLKHGIWGALSDRERRKIRSANYQAARAARAAAKQS